MNLDQNFSSDDPRLTAYALGELESDDSRAIAAWLESDAAARTAVAATRHFAAQLEDSLADEPMMDARSQGQTLAASASTIRRGRFYWWVALAGGVAAILLITIVRHRTESRRRRDDAAQAIAMPAPPQGSSLNVIAARETGSAAAIEPTFARYAPAMTIGPKRPTRAITLGQFVSLESGDNPGPLPTTILAVFAAVEKPTKASTMDDAFVHDPHFTGDPKFVIGVSGYDIDRNFVVPYPNRPAGAESGILREVMRVAGADSYGPVPVRLPNPFPLQSQLQSISFPTTTEVGAAFRGVPLFVPSDNYFDTIRFGVPLEVESAGAAKPSE